MLNVSMCWCDKITFLFLAMQRQTAMFLASVLGNKRVHSHRRDGTCNASLHFLPMYLNRKYSVHICLFQRWNHWELLYWKENQHKARDQRPKMEHNLTFIRQGVGAASHAYRDRMSLSSSWPDDLQGPANKCNHEAARCFVQAAMWPKRPCIQYIQ